MSDAKSIRLDIRREDDGRFRWVVQCTAPVVDLFRSVNTHHTRANAVADFQLVCRLMGWTNDITEVPIDG